jgi:hypothetical protein
LYIKLDCLSELSDEHALGPLFLVFIGVIVIFDLEFVDVEVGDYGVLHEFGQVRPLVQRERVRLARLLVPQVQRRGDVLRVLRLQTRVILVFYLLYKD